MRGNGLRPASPANSVRGMIASFPMYDWPQTRPAWNRFWAATVSEYRAWCKTDRSDLPDIAPTLTWDGQTEAHWHAPDLSLSQTCSLPYRTRLQPQVTLLGSFDFGLPGCAPGYYNSVFVMRKNDRRHATEHWSDLRLAYNAADSQSGWAAAYFHLAPLGIMFADGVETGAHAASARAVAEGRADIAALDAQTYRLLCRHAPVMEALVEVGRTEPTPGLPLITRRGWDAGEFWAAMDIAFNDMPTSDKEALDLRGLTPLHPDRYMALEVPPSPANIFRS